MKIEKFAEKLDAAIKERGLKQKALAEKIGVTERHLSRVKNSGEVAYELLEAICKALDIPGNYFSNEILAEPIIRSDDFFPVPFRDTIGGMGNGSLIASKQILSHISLRRDFLLQKTTNLEKLSFIRASGTSMEPSIPEGSAVLIDESQTEPINFKIFFVFLMVSTLLNAWKSKTVQ